MSRILQFPPSPRTKAEYALRYAAIGWRVMPAWWVLDNGACACGNPNCAKQGKHPLGFIAAQGVNAATTDQAAIRRWWERYPHANIGIAMAGSGLVAIDIDPRNGGDITLDELEASYGSIHSSVQASTGGGGRHMVFTFPEHGGGLPGTLGRGIDIKHHGYIIVEPSVTIGEYLWEASSDPLEGCAPDPLPDWIRDLAHRAPERAGVAAFRAVEESTLADLAAALRYIDADGYHTWVKVGMALSELERQGFDLWDGWSRGSPKYDYRKGVRKWATFRPGDGLHLETVFALAMAAGWGNRGARPAAVMELTMDEPDGWETPLIAIPPDSLPPVAGPAGLEDADFPVPVLRELVGYIEQFSEEPHREISVHGALALISTLAGRLYVSQRMNPPNCYFLTLARTGQGKGYQKTAIKQFLGAAGLIHLVSGSGNTSAGAVFTALFDAPCHIQITDEFGKHLQAARRQKSGDMADAFAVLTEAYSDATASLIPRNYSRFTLSSEQRRASERKVVEWPAITLLAIATPEQVFDQLTSAEIDDGFLNRFIPLIAQGPPGREREISHAPPARELIDWALRVRKLALSEAAAYEMERKFNETPHTELVTIGRQAGEAFDRFKREIKEAEADGVYPEPNLARRWRENAMRLATALAVAHQPEAPTVTAGIADWSIGYVRKLGLRFMDAAASHIADSDFHRVYKLILSAIDKAGLKGVTEYELSEKSRVFERAPVMLQKQAFEAIQRQERARLVELRSRSGKGRPRKAWIGTQFLKEGRE